MKDKRKKPRPWDREPSDMPDVFTNGVRGDGFADSVPRPGFVDPDIGLPLRQPGSPAL